MFKQLYCIVEQLLHLRELLRILLGEKLLYYLRKLHMPQRTRKLRFIKKYLDGYLSVM